MAKKIYIAEDEQALNKVLQIKLKKAGYDVLGFLNGEELMDGLDKEGVADLIVLDLVMPKMSGFEVLERIKGDEKISSTPVIILSNLGQEQDVKKGLELGAKDYVVKSNVSLDDVLKKVAKYV